MKAAPAGAARRASRSRGAAGGRGCAHARSRARRRGGRASRARRRGAGQRSAMIALVEVGLAGEHVVGRDAPALAVDAEAGRGVALRVEVDDQHLLADRGERRAEIDRRRGLADAALLVGEREHARLRDRRRGGRNRSRGVGGQRVHHTRSWRDLIRTILASGSVRLGISSASSLQDLAASVNSDCTSRPFGNRPTVPVFNSGSRPGEELRQAARGRGR